ncbi:hypothetical protein [Mycobacterium hubeiense]|uniref:hypothetical protein n=1 Tax=Mycobacterium hubeiense TaxID=1867256 RepID=UPI000C7F451F|nr:hypothetical protein [Mycobacterium sp. QGD 101]
MNADETWLETVAEKTTDHIARADALIEQTATAANSMRSHCRDQAARLRELAAREPTLAALVELAESMDRFADSVASTPYIIEGLRDWLVQRSEAIEVTGAAVAAAEAAAHRRIADICATGGEDHDAAVAEIVSETRTANSARIAGLRDWIWVTGR